MGKDSRSNGLGVQEIADYELSRLMCYMVAMNADPEKEIALTTKTGIPRNHLINYQFSIEPPKL